MAAICQESDQSRRVGGRAQTTLAVAVAAAIVGTLAVNVVHAAPIVVIEPIAVADQVPPGFAFGDFFDFDTPALNAAGNAAFTGAMTSGVGNTLWREGAGSLELIAQQGQNVPGTPADVEFKDFFNVHINSAGETVLFAQLQGNVTPGLDSSGFWKHGAGGVQLVVRSGDPAPGTEVDTNFSNPSSAVLNDAGDIVFTSALKGPSVVVPDNFTGMWRDAIGGPQLIARRGDVAPLTAEVFSSIGAPSLNGSGHAAFSGSLVGGGAGIWKETARGFELVMRDGDPAPGLGANFSGQSSLRIGFNDAGQTAFVAQVPVPSGQTLWKENAVGDLELVARQGDQASWSGARPEMCQAARTGLGLVTMPRISSRSKRTT